MTDIFRSREAMLQDEAMNAYAGSLNKITAKRQEADKQVEDYNERLRGITDPVGGILATKPLEKVVKSGLRKALGFGADKVEKKITQKLSDVVNGDSEFMNKLPSNVQRGLKAVLQDNPNNEIQSSFKNLSSKAQETINKARVRLGKSEIRANPETTQPAGDTPTATAQNTVTDTPTTTADPAVSTDTAQSIKDDANSALRRFQALPEDSQNDLAQQYRDNPLRIENPSTAEDFRTNINLRSQAIQQEEERLGQGQRPAPESQAEEEDQILGRRGTALNRTRDNPNGANQENNASEGRENPDSDNVGNNNLDNTEAPDANAGTLGADADAGGSDALTGLESASDALDAISASQGGLDIFTDILAGLAGLATIIGGDVGGKPPPKIEATPVSSGIQFGV